MKAYVINLDNRPDRMKLFERNKIPFEVERYSARKAIKGEDGCTLSHMDILSKQKEFPFVIFEDDCVLLEDWSVVEKAMSQLPSDWDALWLGANIRIKLPRYSANLFSLRRAYCTHAIIYGSKKMVDFVVNKYQFFVPKGQNFDIFYSRDVQKRFKCFITYPMVATQLSDYSDIAKKFTDNSQELINRFNRWAK
jgi:GR25 family glycosyltransferase involved in LPS biosynthesis